MVHWQFHRNEIHTIWYLFINMLFIAVILMKHIYMYNTTFCLNSQSLAFFFVVFTFYVLLHIHNSYTLDDDFSPQNTYLVIWFVCLFLRVLMCGECICACACVRVRVCVCWTGLLQESFLLCWTAYSKTRLVSWWCVSPNPSNLIPDPQTT